MNISVVYGGKEEGTASERNARDIVAALTSRGYNTSLISFGKDIIKTLAEAKTDAVYLCVQGKGYGDGTLQAILEHEKIPFTGSGMRAASLINDKILCKLLFDKYGITTPRWRILTRREYEEGSAALEDFGYPFVAKAPTQGGSFGMELIRSSSDNALVGSIFEYDDPILLEDYINGSFYTVGLYEKGADLIALPAVEGYSSLQLDAGEESCLIGHTGDFDVKPSGLDPSVSAQMVDMARKIYEITGAKGYARVDYMVSKDDNTPYVLEINAVPGLKRSSVMPQEAAIAGIEYEDLIEDILLAALEEM